MGATVAALAALIAVGLASCTSQGPPSSDTTITSVITSTRAAAPFTPAPASTVAPLADGSAPAAGEVEKPCPYIASSKDQGPTSMEDLEGNRIYRTTVLTRYRPLGCRFYFWAPPYEAIADILPMTFPTAIAAREAMIGTGDAGTQVEGKPNIVAGVDAVLYRTKFYGRDGARDWACVFAKGRVMVIVHTHRDDTSSSALYIAQAIAIKF